MLALERAADLAGLSPRQIADLFLTGLRLDGMIAGSLVLPVAALLLLAPERWLARGLAALRCPRRAGLLPALLRRDRGLLLLSLLRPASEPPGARARRRSGGDRDAARGLSGGAGSSRSRSPARCSRPGCSSGSRRVRARREPARRARRPRRRPALPDPRRARHARDARPPPAQSRRSPRAPRTASPTKSPARGSSTSRPRRWLRRATSTSPLASVLPPLPEAEALAPRARAAGAHGGLARRARRARSRAASTRPRARSRSNVVLVVMESFTARLVGALGGSPALTPELDRLAAGGRAVRELLRDRRAHRAGPRGDPVFLPVTSGCRRDPPAAGAATASRRSRPRCARAATTRSSSTGARASSTTCGASSSATASTSSSRSGTSRTSGSAAPGASRTRTCSGAPSRSSSGAPRPAGRCSP